MKATKYEVTVKMEVLSLDGIGNLLNKAFSQMDSEFTSGSLSADDGDCVSWEVKSTNVEF